MVAAAVELAGWVTAVAKLCGVARESVYTWIEEWRVERLIDPPKLAARFRHSNRAAGRRGSVPAIESPALSHSDSDPE